MTPRPALLAALALALLAPGALPAAELDPLVPPDTESYLAVNVKAALSSALFKDTLAAPLKALLDEVPQAKAVFDDLGLDPLKDVHRVVFAAPGGADNDRGLVIATGSFDEAKFKKKADDAAAAADESLKVHKVSLGGGVTHAVFEAAVPGQDVAVFVALVSGKVLIASPGKDYVVDALKRGLAGKKAALDNKGFQALVERLDGKQTVSVAALGKSLAAAGGDLLPRAFADALGKVEAVGGGLTITNEVKLDLLVAGQDTAAAERIRETMDKGVKLGLVGLALLAEGRKELGLLLEVVKTVKVGGKGKVVSVSARLTADVLEDFFKKDE